MLLLLSPSKSQNFSPQKLPTADHDSLLKKPLLLKETTFLAELMKQKSSKELQNLMKISEKLGNLNQRRYQSWTPDFSDPKKIDNNGELEMKPSLLAFTGDVYSGFELEKYTQEDFLFAEKNIRIFSGLYGILTPLTLIKPYRLEMGTKISFTKEDRYYKNLPDFWSEQITEKIMNEKNFPIINLASQEYSQTLHRKKISEDANPHFHNPKIIDIYFQVEQEEKRKTVGILAKKQRGRMANWGVRRKIKTPEDVKKYENDGFLFREDLSSEREFYFVKKK